MRSNARYIKANDPEDRIRVLKYHDSFYYKEHLFLVTELLKDNLLEYYKFNLQNESEKFFTLPTLKILSRQILEALAFIHSLDIIHCDIKPENIMVKSYSQPIFKIIDLGSSCFRHDHLSSYVQSRAYRAPEVLLESRYDCKIDVWSFGLVLCELFMGRPVIKNGPVTFVLRQIMELAGAIPEWLRKNGKASLNFFTEAGILMKKPLQEEEEEEEFEDKNSLEGTLYKMRDKKVFGREQV